MKLGEIRAQIGEATKTSSWLKRYLEDDEVDPYHFAHLIARWAEEEDVPGVDPDDFTDYDSLTKKQKKAFKQWLEDNVDKINSDPYDAQPNTYFVSAAHVKTTEWLVHFSDDAYDIAIEGFKYGVSDRHLHLSYTQPDREKEWGEFAFAFKAESRDAQTAARNGKYGRHGVLFQTESGVESFHTGDNENQILFEKSRSRNRIYLYEDGNEFSVMRKEANTTQPVFTGDFKTVVQWVKRNFTQYARQIAHDRG